MRALSAAAGFEGRQLNDDERQSLDTALRYFREAAPRHNADEEESLFPRLRSLPHLEVRRALADIGWLEEEHHWAAPLHLKVDRLGRKWLADGELGKDEAQVFRTAVDKLAAMYRTHIEFEDSVLFPLATRVLTAAQAGEIAAEMAKRRNLDISSSEKELAMSAKTNLIEVGSRDPEDRPIDERNLTQIREKMLDKTIADSFPASDPPSSNPAPAADPFAA